MYEGVTVRLFWFFALFCCQWTDWLYKVDRIMKEEDWFEILKSPAGHLKPSSFIVTGKSQSEAHIKAGCFIRIRILEGPSLRPLSSWNIVIELWGLAQFSLISNFFKKWSTFPPVPLEPSHHCTHTRDLQAHVKFSVFYAILYLKFVSDFSE